MTDTLLEAIREVLKLADEAAPSPWFVRDDNEGMDKAYSPMWVIENKAFDDPPNEEGIDNRGLQAQLNYGYKDDADFMAAAPHMASLLRQCMERMEADQKDAERYRFVKNSNASSGQPFICVYQCESFVQWTGKPADETIDAAINNREQKA